MGFKMRTFRLPKARTEEDLLAINGSSLKRFTWRELKLATSNFSKKNMVGRGGFGSVYRGRLEDGSLVAIKRCHKKRARGSDLQFQAEVEIGGCQASDHGNILRLRGYCMTRQERLLVYPFMVNGSVASKLWERPQTVAPLDWDDRKRIALGAAKGLAHFHCGSSFTVIHRDMKASNILLDDGFEAVVCDFGLAKFVGENASERNSGWLQKQIEEDVDQGEEDESSDEERNSFNASCWSFTRALMSKSEDREVQSRGSTKGSSIRRRTHQVSGTLGYLAPEYYAVDANASSLKTDVYGYGVVLLELISGRKAFDPARREKDDHVLLLDWAKKLVGDKQVHLVVDPDLRRGTGFVEEEMEQLLQLALLCTISTPQDRPLMPEVIKKIEDIGNIPCHDQPPPSRPQGINQGAYDSTLAEPEHESTASSSHFSWDRVEEPKMEDRWKNFLYEVVSDALPTKYKLWGSGMSFDPLCPLCKNFKEDSLHLFFMCEFSNQVWQLAIDIRMDMLAFGSAKEAVDAILRLNQLSQLSHDCVAVMYSIWTHRNKVCFEKVPPKVTEVVEMLREVGSDCGAISEADLREAFEVFDVDGDGRITAPELQEVFKAMGDDQCTLEDCQRMIAGVDKNGNGVVCFEDFARMMLE